MPIRGRLAVYAPSEAAATEVLGDGRFGVIIFPVAVTGKIEVAIKENFVQDALGTTFVFL